MVAQVCSLFDRVTSATLVQQLAPAFIANGTLTIVTTLAGDSGAMHELSLCPRPREGVVHQPDAYQNGLPRQA